MIHGWKTPAAKLTCWRSGSEEHDTMKMASCPICGKRFVIDAEQPKPPVPFCSMRCRDVDLNRWFSEDYSVPVQTRRVIDEAVGDQADGAEFDDSDDDWQTS